jgi:hypothetical protein
MRVLGKPGAAERLLDEENRCEQHRCLDEVFENKRDCVGCLEVQLHIFSLRIQPKKEMVTAIGTGEARFCRETMTCDSLRKEKADGEGFEPPVRLPVQQFSRLPP